MDDSNKPLSKLIPLRNSMRENEKAVIVFRFHYKRSGYYVAVCLLTDEDKKKKEAKYALVRLCFILQNDLNQYLDCYANSIKFSAGMTELRNFLGVEFQPDGREWIQGFTQYFGKFIPEYIPQMDSSEKRIALHTICRHEGRDPNRIYRSYIFRNGKQNGKQKYTLGFRDPKVIRVKTKHYPNGIWLMVVAGEQARLFSSENLINWTLNDEFFYPDGGKIVSECPDFFPMQTQDGEEKWVFLGNDYNDGNSRIFYVVGNLSEDEAGRLHFEAQTDGKNSMNLNPEAYASQTFYNDKKGRRIMIAWLRDWVLFDGTVWKFENINKYSKYWLGTFTLPQELFLTKENGEYRMLARPVEEVNFLRKSKIFSSVNSFMSSVIIRKTKFLDMEFRAKTDNFRNPLQLRISGENKESGEEIDEEVVITYDAGTRLFRLDKSKTPGAFVPVYSYITEKPDIFSFRLIADTSVLEIYLNDGEKVLSTQFYIRGKHRFELNFDGISEYLNAYEPLTDRAECYINSKV